MKLQRCKDQPGTLESFYAKMIEGDALLPEIGTTMLHLLERLRKLPDEQIAWGLTSHYTLCLLSENRGDAPWYVKVVALNNREYLIEYRMPESIAPWPEAYVKGEARSEEEAVRMLLKGMVNSGGWAAQS